MRYEIVWHEMAHGRRYVWWIRGDRNAEGLEPVLIGPSRVRNSEEECRAEIAAVMGMNADTPVVVLPR